MLLIWPEVSCCFPNTTSWKLSDSWSNGKHGLWLLWTIPSPPPPKVVLPGLSAQSSLPQKAFVTFIVISLTQFPTQHRYTDWGWRVGGMDLWITKIPYKAIRGLWNFKARRPQEGRLSKDLMSVTFSLSHSPGAWFGGNSIKMFTSYQ